VNDHVAELRRLYDRRLSYLPDIAMDLYTKQKRLEYLEALLELRDNSNRFKVWMHKLLDEAKASGMTC